jgi:hypothetical protein
MLIDMIASSSKEEMYVTNIRLLAVKKYTRQSSKLYSISVCEKSKKKSALMDTKNTPENKDLGTWKRKESNIAASGSNGLSTPASAAN